MHPRFQFNILITNLGYPNQHQQNRRQKSSFLIKAPKFKTPANWGASKRALKKKNLIIDKKPNWKRELTRRGRMIWVKRRRTGRWGRWHRLPGLPDLGVEGGTVTRRWPVVDGRVRLVRWSGPVPVIVIHQHHKER